jgi:hypothetical protein
MLRITLILAIAVLAGLNFSTAGMDSFVFAGPCDPSISNCL